MQEIIDYSKELFGNHNRNRATDFSKRNFSPDILHKALSAIAGKSTGLLNVQLVGKSFEGREIQLVKAGTGNISVLLWSQMHGDESTATMSICDILNYLIDNKNVDRVRMMFSALTLNFLPMVNPDGAERFQRRTAQGIDMNRDALSLATPEAKLLKQLQHELTPSFGFNLHDQELSTVGSSKVVSAIGLLAPAFDQEKSENEIRERAKCLASVFAHTMNQFIPGRITKYDDSYEPRAFGDSMQKWGTSTLLVESGHAPNDPEKEFIRKLNFTGILTALYAIACGEYKKSDITNYEKLPFNGKRAYDVIIRNVLIEHQNGKSTRADLGISYQVDTHSEHPPKLVDIGDLSSFAGSREIDGTGKTLPHKLLSINQPFEWEKYG